ncbi:MAG TPA: AAA family ATPase [Allosphingosinicella sp.]|nr:AAA family ATPase [Allosphingosinicella sp.]
MEIVVDNSRPEIEARAWLNDHKDETGLSWSEIAKLTSVASSTLSRFASAQYAGDNGKIAAGVLAYRDRLTAQAEIGADMPRAPDWFETETSRRLTSLLRWAQSGKIVLIVTSPGLGKTKVAQRLADRDPNVWLATMAPSTAGVATMAIEVAAAIGLGDVKGSPQQLSRQIRAHVQGKNGLLIIDEAQELTDKALNEIRGWHDRTKMGIALLGNEKVVGQLDTRKSALAQISSRFSIKHVQALPLEGDLEALLDAWGVQHADQRAFLGRIGSLPGALREVTQTLEVAMMAAFGANQPLTVDHLRAAAKQRNVKIGGL